MSKSMEHNIETWEGIYRESNFGNRYPSSYLVSLLHNIIKKNLPQNESRPKALDFACSFGANSRMLRDAGFEVYGIDISDLAIKHCIGQSGFDEAHFKCINILKTEEVEQIFGTSFDLIIASEVLYYFSKNDLKVLLQKFHGILRGGGIIYGNMATLGYGFYKDCKGMEPNEDGMYRIEASGSADKPLYLSLVDTKEDMENLFTSFETIAILEHTWELEVPYRNINYIGKKAN
jgi:SAM-dependent methyltransferase